MIRRDNEVSLNNRHCFSGISLLSYNNACNNLINRCVARGGGARVAHLPAGQLLHKSIRMSPYAVALCSSRLEIRGPSRRLQLCPENSLRYRGVGWLLINVGGGWLARAGRCELVVRSMLGRPMARCRPRRPHPAQPSSPSPLLRTAPRNNAPINHWIRYKTTQCS